MSSENPDTGALDATDEELAELLEALYDRYRFDFRNYALPSLRRRISSGLREEGVRSLAEYGERLLADAEVMERFLLLVTVNVTTMFRDPEFYRSFREKVVPLLASRPFFRVWHAGCSTGEEVYSFTILLKEEGLLERCRIYATDMNDAVLWHARSGIYSAEALREFTTNYLRAGGRGAFSQYYTARYGRVIFQSSLRQNIVFSRHNLATDGSFHQFDVVLCRNVLIYFNNRLAAHVHRLLHDSMVPGGILGLGQRETIGFTPHEADYEPIDAEARLYRKRAYAT